MKKIVFFIILVSVIILEAGQTSHIVQKGDTLYSISKRYGMSVDSLKSLNSLTGTEIKIGQRLKLESSSRKIITHKVKSGETLWRIAYNHSMTVSELQSLNRLNFSNPIKPGQVLKVYEGGERTAPSGNGPSGGRFPKPVNGELIQEGSEKGVRILCRKGERVHVVRAGKVEYTGELVGYGRVVIIRHEEGLYSIYGCMGSVNVRKGDQVGARQIIGSVEKFPYYNYSFLYLELVYQGRNINPVSWLQ